LNKTQKCFKILVELKSKFSFKTQTFSRSSLDLSLNASQKFQTLKFFPRYIFLSNLRRPKNFLKNSDDKDDDDDDDDDDEVS
jgi:hypothetical protein